MIIITIEVRYMAVKVHCKDLPYFYYTSEKQLPNFNVIITADLNFDQANTGVFFTGKLP